MSVFVITMDIICLVLCLLNSIIGFKDDNNSAGLGWTTACIWIVGALITDIGRYT